MKKYLGILVVLCMLTTLLIPGFALAAENILDNGGLETGDTTGWTTYPPGNFASGNIAISAVEEAAYSGSYGLKLETTANNPAWGKTGAYLTVTASKLDLSKEYVLSCYVKSADGKNRKLQLQATYRDKNTAGLYDYKSDEVTVGAEWQKLSLTMAAGNTVLSSESQAAVDCLEVYVQNAINEENAGTYYADDMEMTEIEDVQTVSNTISIGEHGKVTIAGKDYTGESQLTDLIKGGILQFTAVPDEGYEIDTITYDSKDVTGTALTVVKDAVLKVTFRIKTDGNLLDNGGLETGDTTGWTTYPPGNFASGNIAISAVAEAAHTGSYGLKLETTANTPAWSNTGAYLTVAGSKIDLSKEYVLSCYVKSADGKNRKLRLAAMYRNAATDGLYTYASDFVTVGAEWQKLSLTMAAGNTVLTSEQQAEMYSMEVYVQNPITEESAGTYYADDMEMTEIEDVRTVSNTISVGEHGKVTIAGKDYTGESQLTDLMEGGTLQFTVVPDEGYEVDTVTYNGARIGAGSTVTVAADAALCVTFSKRADGNLVENCGFESGHTNGWAVYPPNGWGAWSELTQEAARTGVYSLKIRTENNVPDFDHTGAYLSLMVDKMNPSKAYEASAWLKSADGKNHDIKIYAVYRNQATDALKGLVSDTAVTITPDEWKQVSFTIDEVLSDAYVLEICFANPNDGSNNGSYYLDDCSIAEQSRIVSNTVSVGEHGKVTIAGKDYTCESQIDGLTAGEPLSYTVTPDEGYEIDTITYNGVSLSEGMEPTVTADGTLTVTFRVKAPVLPSVTQNGTAIVSEDYDGTGYTAKTFYFSSVIPTGWTADGYGAYLTDDIASGNMIQLEGRVITNGQFAIRVFGDAVQNTKYFMKGYLTDGTNEYTGDWQSSN